MACIKPEPDKLSKLIAELLIKMSVADDWLYQESEPVVKVQPITDHRYLNQTITIHISKKLGGTG